MAKKIVSDDVSIFHNYDLHIPTRTIYVGSSFGDMEGGESGTDNFMAEKVIKDLHILDNVGQDGDKPINIIMNNPGGDWYHGMAIYDAITACKNHITITIFGYAMSMGSIILQAADERVMSRNSRMMLHYGEDGYAGHTLDFQQTAEESKYTTKIMENIYLDRIKVQKKRFNLKKLQELIRFDRYLSAEEAVNLGLCDKVIPADETENDN